VSEMRREGVRREHDRTGPDRRAVRGGDRQRRTGAFDAGERRALVDLDAEVTAGVSQPPREAGRVDQRLSAALPGAGEVRGRVDLGAEGIPIEPGHVLAGRDGLVHPDAQVVDLPRLGGDGEVAGPFERAVDPVPDERRLDAVEVLPAQLLEAFELVGEPVDAVGDAVGQRRRAEAAVPPRRLLGHAARLDHGDPTAGICLLRLERRPQPGVARADHEEVGGDVGRECR